MARAAAVLALLLVLAGCGGDGGSAAAGEEAEQAALEHVGDRDATETTVESEVDGDAATVTIEFDGLRDDSVRTERRVVELLREGDAWRVRGDSAEYRCHEGRGHQDFSAELCR
jgi:hypothetical protein